MTNEDADSPRSFRYDKEIGLLEYLAFVADIGIDLFASLLEELKPILVEFSDLLIAWLFGASGDPYAPSDAEPSAVEIP